MSTSIWTVIVAGGSGSRFGSLKQFEPLGLGVVVDQSVLAAQRNSDGVVLVAPDGYHNDHGADVVVAGGPSRAASVRRGLAALPEDAGIVLVHDGARPLASDDLYQRVIRSVGQTGQATVPVVDLADSLRNTTGGAVDRSQFVAVQTPQGFPRELLEAAHRSESDATDDATLVEELGYDVVTVEGEHLNLKITTRKDLALADWALRDQDGSLREDREMQLRVGNGFDIHRFSDDSSRRLVLGGVEFPGERGLVGHSDADVVAHVCAEALLGAAGLGDLGSHFPDTDPQWAGANSVELLAGVAEKVRSAGWSVSNIDCSIVAEEPKLAPVREAIQLNLSTAVGAPVTIKGRRAEKLGSLGRSEGIAAFASTLLMKEN